MHKKNASSGSKSKFALVIFITTNKPRLMKENILPWIWSILLLRSSQIYFFFLNRDLFLNLQKTEQTIRLKSKAKPKFPKLLVNTAATEVSNIITPAHLSKFIWSSSKVLQKCMIVTSHKSNCSTNQANLTEKNGKNDA